MNNSQLEVCTKESIICIKEILEFSYLTMKDGYSFIFSCLNLEAVSFTVFSLFETLQSLRLLYRVLLPPSCFDHEMIGMQ